METLVIFAAWFLLISNVAYVLISPLFIGKPKTGRNEFWEWLLAVVSSTFIVVIVGRVFGWW